jgi:8-oxo-dGTP pyrophosphatase MutT (NUDIX family)
MGLPGLTRAERRIRRAFARGEEVDFREAGDDPSDGGMGPGADRPREGAASPAAQQGLRGLRGITAAREVEEETGWRPRSIEHVLTFQPMIGNGDFPQDLYLARGAPCRRTVLCAQSGRGKRAEVISVSAAVPQR